MTNTTNYNLLLAEGTDLVNYLTQTNPNFSNLDTIIKGVSDLTVTPATEVTTGTAHAISRSLADATVIKFTATSNWQTGDTMTLDGNPVTPLKTDGTTLKTGDYIIGSAVLMIQDGTRLTVLVASSPDASDINYDNTGSGLTANKVQGAVDELASEVDTINSNLSNKFKFISDSQQISLAPNEKKAGTFSITPPTGYHFGSVTVSTRVGSADVCLSAVTTSSVYYYVQNESNSSETYWIDLRIIFYKD